MSADVTPLTCPLTTAQTEIWLAQQIHTNAPVYHIAQYTTIHGAIEPSLFETALRQVINEAEILRLRFIESDGGLRQYVDSPPWSLPLVDFSAEADPKAAAEAWMQAHYERPVDILCGPLFHYAVLKIASDRVLWYQFYHHIVMDGVGMHLIAQRVAHVYSAMCDKVEPEPCPFGSVRQLLESDAQYRTGNQWTRDEAYWLQYCTDWPEPTTLASRAASSLQHRIRQTSYLSSQSIGDYAADASRLAQLVTAAMAAYLHRMTGTQDVVLGLPVTARFGADRHTPGMVANVVPLRLNVQPDMNLSSLMQQIAQGIQRGLRYQRYPSEALRRKLARISSQPLFSTTVNIMPFDYNLSFGGHTSTNHNLLNGPIEDLMLGVYLLPDNPRLRVDCNANSACYTADELIAHQRRFVKLLETLAADPSRPIKSIDLLDAAERRRLLVEWNATECEYPSHLCVHQLFEAQVERTPDATALIVENQTLSYKELNARANRLAHHLRALGVRPGSCVALYVQRSPEMVIGMLATLKAGGAYVPLDPTYPPERLADMVTDSTPVAVLSIQALHTAVAQRLGAGVPVLDLQAHAVQWRDRSANNLDAQEVGLNAHHLAYVIYTSGSTGRPKGVMIQHSGVVNQVTAMARALRLSAKDRALQFASLSFDTSVEEIFSTLTSGATLVLRSDTWLAGARQFWTLCEANRISVVNLPTQFWAQLIQEKAPIPDSVRVVIVGGDTLSASAWSAWFAGDGHRPRLLNTYGPTETTISATTHEVTRHDGRWRSIGRAIANTRIYILDAWMQPVPPGAVGELYIGGAGVARGYLNRPDLTLERFLPDPFTHVPDARMYKTGDMVRYLTDGTLEFLGRNDHQVKIRGFRVELDEIEVQLATHPEVRDAIVLARDGQQSQTRLVAYVTLREGAPVDASPANALRAHLETRLPEYMIPAAFVRLDALPLTPNGKLDRKALPAPSGDAWAHTSCYAAPQGEIETLLASLWSELLGVEQVSRHDAFFALGGHSLLAVLLVNRMADYGYYVALKDIFQFPVLGNLASHITPTSDVGPLSRVINVRAGGTGLPIFFVPTGLGDYSYAFALAPHLDASWPIYGLPWPSVGESPPATAKDLASYLISFLKAVQPTGPYRLIGYSGGGILAYTIAEVLLANGDEVAFVGLIDTLAPYCLRAWPTQTKSLFLDYVEYAFKVESPTLIGRLRRDADHMELVQLIEEVQRLGLFPRGLSACTEAERWEFHAHITRQLIAYEPRPLPITVHQLYSTETLPLPTSMRRPGSTEERVSLPSDRGWQAITSPNGIKTIQIPGNHATIMNDAHHRAQLGNCLNQALFDAQRSREGCDELFVKHS
uniref:Dimodular nonribosomal peptide synthase NecA n=2 Tax=Burkholderiaceae TaxID=119060 RepID=A0A6G6CX06_9BURK|nr:dimodular nonribosomal peptide synthase NecA [Burkholderia sp. B8(2020)]